MVDTRGWLVFVLIVIVFLAANVGSLVYGIISLFKWRKERIKTDANKEKPDNTHLIIGIILICIPLSSVICMAAIGFF